MASVSLFFSYATKGGNPRPSLLIPGKPSSTGLNPLLSLQWVLLAYGGLVDWLGFVFETEPRSTGWPQAYWVAEANLPASTSICRVTGVSYHTQLTNRLTDLLFYV